MQGWGLSTVPFPISIFHFPAEQGGGGRRKPRPYKDTSSASKPARRQARELMATGVVGKGAADEHSIQKLAATADFGQRRVVLQGIWIHSHGAIEHLARREYTVRPARQFIGFILEQLESELVVLSGLSYLLLPEH